MPRFRPDLADLKAFRPDRSLDDAARARGVDNLAKLSFNESPASPFAEVRTAVIESAHEYNRYPDTSRSALRRALAEHLSVSFDNLWVGAGSVELIMYTALATGGVGTSAVCATPSFFIYPKLIRLSGAEPIRVPLNDAFNHDLPAMRAAMRDDTTLVILCNPNNPTGTYIDRQSLWSFIDDMPESALILIDEAYFEYVAATDYASALPLALERDNVVVTRTFSKIYSLAGLRVGYMIGKPDTLAGLHKIQTPFTVPDIAQAAAIEALRHQSQVQARLRENQAGLARIYQALTERGIAHVTSHANFVYCDFGEHAEDLVARFMSQGIAIARIPTGWFRVNVGTPAENERFAAALARVLS